MHCLKSFFASLLARNFSIVAKSVGNLMPSLVGGFSDVRKNCKSHIAQFLFPVYTVKEGNSVDDMALLAMLQPALMC